MEVQFLAKIEPEKGVQLVKSKIWETMKTNWLIWPAATTINFWFMPLKYQVLFANFIGLFWNIILSYITYKWLVYVCDVKQRDLILLTYRLIYKFIDFMEPELPDNIRSVKYKVSVEFKTLHLNKNIQFETKILWKRSNQKRRS